MHSAALNRRLVAVQNALMAGYEGGSGLSSSTRGTEREQFVKGFLERVLPPMYRFGTGDAIDRYGRRSGQLDVVVECSLAPSLPSIGAEPRIYLAEGIAGVIEVKSNIADQWDEVLSVARQLRPLCPDRSSGMVTFGGTPSPHIPLFAVGYTGWRQLDTVKEKVAEAGLDGALVIDIGIFTNGGDTYALGPGALWGFASVLHRAAANIVASSFSAFSYLLDPPAGT